MLLLIDSNILLRIVEPKHAHFAVAKSAMETLDDLGYTKVIVPQVVYEF